MSQPPVLVAYAKLAGLLRKLQNLMDPHPRTQKIPPWYEHSQILEIQGTYKRQLKVLKEHDPEIFGDIADKKEIPEDEEGLVGLWEVQDLNNDIEYIFEVRSQLSADTSKNVSQETRIFLSHGRSGDWRLVQEYVEKTLEYETLELAQQPSMGRTVIQKLNEESDRCSYAIVIMTAEDEVEDGEKRVRENVMHELGFFQGKYGLQNVCMLHEENANIPSNVHGIVYIPYTKGTIESTFGALHREIETAFR